MNWKNKENKRLIQAIMSLASKSEAELFLRDLLTEKEIVEFSKRLQTTEMLTDKISYATIEKETGLSSITVARVSKWLNGKGGGYKKVIQKLHHHKPLQSSSGLS